MIDPKKLFKCGICSKGFQGLLETLVPGFIGSTEAYRVTLYYFLGVPYYTYTRRCPKSPILITKDP